MLTPLSAKKDIFNALKALYSKQDTLEVLQTHDASDWTLKLPIEKIYTPLAIIGEREKEEKKRRTDAPELKTIVWPHRKRFLLLKSPLNWKSCFNRKSL